jgi:ATP-binding cassette subfamily B (MDR/TAP) protein 1
MEEFESNLLTKKLTEANKNVKRTNLGKSLILSLFAFAIYATYTFTLFVGCKFVDTKIYNQSSKTIYTAGDVLSILICVVFSFYQFASANNLMRVIEDGKIAMRAALDLIERVPAIQDNQEGSEELKLEGDITFRNVTFFYPLTPNKLELNQFNLTLEANVTTAIVGGH